MSESKVDDNKENIDRISNQLRNDNIFLLEQVKQLTAEAEALKKEKEEWTQSQEGSASGFLNSLSTQISKHVQIHGDAPVNASPPKQSKDSRLEDKIKTLEKELLEVHEEKAKLETTLREHVDVQIKSLSAEKEALQRENEILNKKILGMQEELEHISDGKEKAGILEKENESLKQQIFSMQESVEGLEAAMEESRDRYVHIKEKAESQNEITENTLKDLRKELDDVNSQLQKSLQNTERLKRDLRASEEKTQHVQQAHIEQIQKLKAENASTSLDLFQVRSELVNNLSNRSQKEENLQQLVEDKTSLETRFEAAIDLLAEMRAKNEKQEEVITGLRISLEKKEIELGIALEMIVQNKGIQVSQEASLI